MIANWQEWVVLAILLGCLIILILKISTFFRKAKNNENPCAGCASDCKLKDQLKSTPHSTKRTVDCADKKCS